MDANRDNFGPVSYFVAVDRTLPTGGRVVNQPISKRTASKRACSRIWKQLHRTTPDCFMVAIGSDRGCL